MFEAHMLHNKDAIYVNQPAMSTLLGVKQTSLASKNRMISNDDSTKWFSDNAMLLYPRKINPTFKQVNANIKRSLDEGRFSDYKHFHQVEAALTTQIDKCAYKTGMFGKNIEKHFTPALVSDANGKMLYKYWIDQMTISYRAGYEEVRTSQYHEYTLPFAITSNVGMNPKGYKPFVHDVSSKLDFLHDWKNHGHKFINRKDYFNQLYLNRAITAGFRLTMEGAKQRPSFLLDKTQKMVETLYMNDHAGFRVRQVANIPWFDNIHPMTINQCIYLGMTDFLKDKLKFSPDQFDDIFNVDGYEVFATDVPSGDFSHNEEDIEFFFKTFADGELYYIYESQYKTMPIAGTFNLDAASKRKIYYFQRNFGRFESGGGLTTWINNAKYGANATLNLINYHRKLISDNRPVFKAPSVNISENEVKKCKFKQKGDDNASFLKKGTSHIFNNCLKDNYLLLCEIELPLAFDGKILEVINDRYHARSRPKAALVNLVEKREKRNPSNGLVPLFFNSLLGKIDLFMLYPLHGLTATQSIELFSRSLTFFGFSDKECEKLTDRDYVAMLAETELSFLGDNSRIASIQQVTTLLGLKSSNDIYHRMDNAMITSLPKVLVDDIFIQQSMNELLDCVDNIVANGRVA